MSQTTAAATDENDDDGIVPDIAVADLIDEARGLEDAGRYAEAADAWDWVAMVAGDEGDMTLVERVRLAAAHCKIEVGRDDAAAVDLEIAGASPELAIAGPAARTAAGLYLRRHDPVAAELSYRQAAIRFERLGWTVDLAGALLGLGEVLGGLDRLDEAVDLITQARDLYRSTARGLDAAYADDRLAAAFIQLGRYDEALERLEASARIADATNDGARIAYAQYRMGWTLVIAERSRQALPWLSRARDKYAELGDLVGGANCDEKAAMAYSDLQDFDRALDLYNGAIAVFEAFGQLSSARIAESNVAGTYSRLGRHEEAAARREALLDKLPEGDEYVASAVTVRLALDLLEIDRPAQAMTKLDEVAPLFIGRQSVVETARYRAARARALLALDCVSSAQDEAESVLDEFDRTAVPEEYAAVLHVLAECERRSGNAEQADRLLAQAVALYLAVDEHDQATHLSRMLLPDREPKSRTVAVREAHTVPGYI